MKFFKNLSYYIIPLLVALFNILIIITPNIVISSAKEGLLLWFNNILPSILPFLIGTNLLIHLGFIDFLGTLLEPFMKKIFNVSGSGAFALVLGMFSGYPIGAEITSNLREKGKISTHEAQRLISFTNNSGPLFIIGTVGIGMFTNIKIGYLMLIIHYISALTVGFLFRFYKSSEHIPEPNDKPSIKTALTKLRLARIKNNKSLGSILGDSVRASLDTIAMIGGFVILFSVISELLKASQIFDIIGNLIFPEYMEIFSNGLFIGIIEITNGINTLAPMQTVSSVIICSGLISFSGLSILAQTANVIKGSDIKLGLYIFSKTLHSIFSVLYAFILSPLISHLLINNTSSVFASNDKVLLSSSINFILGICILMALAVGSLYIIKSNHTKKRIHKR